MRLIEAFRNFTITFKFSCFNVESEEEILKGLKGCLKEDEALRGKDLTVLFNIDYDEIIEERKKDGCENIAYFIKNLLKINNIRSKIIDILLGDETYKSEIESKLKK